MQTSLFSNDGTPNGNHHGDSMRKPMGTPWGPHGNPMDTPWETPWKPHGKPHGTPMETPWKPHGNPRKPLATPMINDYWICCFVLMINDISPNLWYN